jgi:hypothetical protein
MVEFIVIVVDVVLGEVNLEGTAVKLTKLRLLQTKNITFHEEATNVSNLLLSSPPSLAALSMVGDGVDVEGCDARVGDEGRVRLLLLPLLLSEASH